MINALAAYNRSHNNFKDVFKEPLDYVEGKILAAIDNSLYSVYIPISGGIFEWGEEDWENLGGRFIKGLEEFGYKVIPKPQDKIQDRTGTNYAGLTIFWDNPCN